MTITTTNLSAPLTFGGLLQRLTSAFSALGHGIEALAEARSRRDQIEALMRLSDEALAARGLTREGIVAHVFRDRAAL